VVAALTRSFFISPITHASMPGIQEPIPGDAIDEAAMAIIRMSERDELPYEAYR